MSSALHSTSWYRVATLRPRLAAQVKVHRHRYRGDIWYVIEDRAAGKFHRFNPEAYRIISAMDGSRSMQQIWDGLLIDLHEHTPSQEDVVQMLGQLSAADLITTEADIDVAELFERHRKQHRQKTIKRFTNPLAIRIPLFDPDRLLARWSSLTRHVPALAWAAIWFAAVLPAVLLAPAHWSELTRNFNEQLLAANNLWVLAIGFTVSKVLHEFGHGWAVRARGGEVHETGVMLLLLYPVPYVDASYASGFTSKWARMFVGAAGMIMEVWVAAMAFIAWLLLEPGIARTIAYNMVVVGSVSTVVFNANPLLRYDGYHILGDWLEIPNLGNRANAFWHYLMRRRAFGIASTKRPEAMPAEVRWFIGYAPLAAVYRLFITFSIAWFVGQQYFFVGVVIAIWALVSGFLWPVCRGLGRLWADPQVAGRPMRVAVALACVPLLLGFVLFALPAPHHTRVVGVVSLPENAIVRAQADGFVQRVVALPGHLVAAGSPIVEADSIDLRHQLDVQAAKLAEATVRRDAARANQPAAAARLDEDVRREQAALARLDLEKQGLVVRALGEGRLVLENADDLPGQALKKGAPVAYIVGEHPPLLRVVVGLPFVDAVRRDTRSVTVRMPQAFTTELSGRLVREVPKAGKELPSASLGIAGGGNVVVESRDEHGLTALEALFEFEVELPSTAAPPHLGSRAYVAFEHTPEAIGWRLWRLARRNLLSHFHV